MFSLLVYPVLTIVIRQVQPPLVTAQEAARIDAEIVDDIALENSENPAVPKVAKTNVPAVAAKDVVSSLPAPVATLTSPLAPSRPPSTPTPLATAATPPPPPPPGPPAAHTKAVPKVPPPTTTATPMSHPANLKGSLLEQIVAGKKLKKATKVEKAKTPANGLGGILAQSMKVLGSSINPDQGLASEDDEDDDDWD